MVLRRGRLALLGVTLLAATLGLAAVAHAADPVIAGAGNIACQSTSPYFNAGLGTPTRCRAKYTSDLLAGAGLATVLPLGDNQSCCGSLTSYLESYDKTWGGVKAISRPVPGDHDYATSGAPGYFDYFNGAGALSGPAGERGKGYYSFDLGAWHLIALNSNCRHVGCTAGAPQERWLRSDLAQHPTACTLAYMHDSRFTSGDTGNRLQLQPFWQALHEAGAEVVLGGGSHMYERFALQTARGRADPAFGIRQFVVGTGGHSLGGVRQIKRSSEVRENGSFGVLRLVLHPSGYDWRFQPDGSSAFSDSGSALCHGPRPVRVPKPKKNRCTLSGTSGDDMLRGTPGNDVICGLDGADTIDGGAGSDVILGGVGRDRILGGAGKDRLYGGDDDDVIVGAGDADVVLAGRGNDRVSGGRGRDRISGEDGGDILRGGAGRDVILGGRGRDRVRAGAGTDIVYGNAGNDVIRGQRGADRLLGNGGRNRLLGGAGRDRLVSFVSRHAGDRLNGGSGRDWAVMDRRDRARSVEHITRLH